MLATHHGRFCGLEGHNISACSRSLSLPRLLSAGRHQIKACSRSSQAIPDQTLTMGLCAPLVGVPLACFSLTKIKLSAAFLTCETTKSVCLSPYWGHGSEPRMDLVQVLHAGALVCF